MRPTTRNRRALSLSILILLAGFACKEAQASTITQTLTLTPSGSNGNVTNGHLLLVFDVSPSFNQFNPALGPLNSAELVWTGSGSLTVTGNNEGVAVMSYETTSDAETWNIFGGSTAVNFSLSGSELLNLATVTGTGTFHQGDFKETYQLQQGFFPATFSTGPTTGTFTFTYDYGTPEPASIMMVSAGIALLTLWFRRRSHRNARA